MKSHTKFSYIIAHLDTFSNDLHRKTLEENKEHTNKEEKLQNAHFTA